MIANRRSANRGDRRRRSQTLNEVNNEIKILNELDGLCYRFDILFSRTAQTIIFKRAIRVHTPHYILKVKEHAIDVYTDPYQMYIDGFVNCGR